MDGMTNGEGQVGKGVRPGGKVPITGMDCSFLPSDASESFDLHGVHSLIYRSTYGHLGA